MKVHNILINRKDEYIELLVRELIKYGINYLQIDNEIHFDNRIFRFYDIKDDIEEIKKIIIEEDLSDVRIINVDELEKLEEENKLQELPYQFQIFEPKNDETKEKTPVPKLNKKLIKSYNKKINKRINTRKK